MNKAKILVVVLLAFINGTVFPVQGKSIDSTGGENNQIQPYFDDLLYPDLIWIKNSEKMEIDFLINGISDTESISGISFTSNSILGKPPTAMVEFYLPDHMKSLGWKLVGYRDESILLHVEYYNPEIGRGSDIRIGRCSQIEGNALGALSEDFCIQVWMSSTDIAPTPVVNEVVESKPSVKNNSPEKIVTLDALTIPFFSQRSSDPNNNTILGYGNCSTTIHDYGCVVTSYAMIYNYYQSNFTNPLQLNDSLKAAPGLFAQYQTSGCYNLWPDYVNLPDAPAGVSGANRVYNNCTAVNCIDPNNITLIDSELSQGHPIHIRVHWSGAAESSHSVVMIGHSGTEYSILDPWATDSGTRTLTSGAIAPYVVDWVIPTHGTPSGGGSCNNPSPSSDQVGIYTDPNYCGNYKIFNQGEWANPGAMGFGNDAVSSVKVGGNVKAVLCKDDNYAGGCEEFTGDDSNLSDNSIGDNTVSSMKVQSRGSSTGAWTANYYDTIDRWWDNNNGNNFKCSENVGGPILDKNYGSSGPCGMDGDTWIADYSGTINFPTSNYVFLVDHDDGAKVWLNGQNIADYGGSGSTEIICPARPLSGNVNMRAMLREDGGDARIKLSWSTDASLCTPPAPTAPSNLRVTSATQSSVTFAWNDNSNNENGFRIYKWNGSAWASIGAVGPNATSFTDSDLSCGSLYSYDVSAYNDTGEVISSGDFLSAQTLSCPTAPNTPGNFRITATTQTSITMSWDDTDNETEYRIYRWDGEGFIYYATVGENVTSYTDSQLPCDASQFYEVSAVNTLGESGYAGWIEGRTTSCLAACYPVLNISLGGFDSGRNDRVGSQNLIQKYGDVVWMESGPEITYSLDLSEDADVTVKLSQLDTDLDIFVVSGAPGQCHSSNLIAYGNDQATFHGKAGERYYLVIDGYLGAVGNYRIDVLETPSVFLPLILR